MHFLDKFKNKNRERKDKKQMKKCTRNAQKTQTVKLARNRQDCSKDFDECLSYEKDNYVSRINAMNLLALEKGLLQHLKSVKETLAYQYSIDDQRTVREVLEDEKGEQCEK
jgi:hypothetical protein